MYRLRNRTKVAIAVVGVAAAAFGAATATADTVNSTVSGGLLTATTYGAILGGITLSGDNQNSTGTSSSAWSFEDARGTGAGWTIAVTATTWTSAAGTVETVARTIAVGALSMTIGTITAGDGADPVGSTLTGVSGLAMDGGSQSVITSTGTNKGTYAATPTYSLAVPANAFRSNYTTGTSGALNPYTTTLTYTIA